MTAPPLKAVFFDVDFTLIQPGPRFLGPGYAEACAPHGLALDATLFEAAVARALPILDGHSGAIYDHDLFIRYTAAIIEHMGGGQGDAVTRAASEIYDAWAANHHFEIYDDVHDVLLDLTARGLTLGVISNSHRSLEAFTTHFELDRVVSVHVSAHPGRHMKPHRSIFEAALHGAKVRADEALMIGDSLHADVEGALAAGLRAVWLRRGGDVPVEPPTGVRVIHRLRDLLEIVETRTDE
jgi:putative hydrolase of the HAD superfamily